MDYNYLAKSSDIYKQHKDKTLTNFKLRSQTYPEHMLLEPKDILPRFKELVADLYCFFNVYKKILTVEESILATTPYEVKKKLTQEILTHYGKIFKDQMTSYANEIETICQDLSANAHARHKAYFQELLLEIYTLTCPFTARAYQKPHGYAGDYILMSMICEQDPFTGDSLYQQCLQYFTVNSPSAAPVKNRVKLIYSQIVEQAKLTLQQKDNFRIFDVASGPSVPVQLFLENNPESNQLEAYFLDQDPLAMDYLQNRLAILKERFHRKSRFNYYSKKIQDVFMDSSMLQDLNQQDFIFSSGLFDYLTDDLAKMLIQALYSLLAPGGSLLIGNLSDQSTGKVFQWYVNDWPIFFRSETQLRSLAPEGVQAEILKEELGFNYFMKLSKALS